MTARLDEVTVPTVAVLQPTGHQLRTDLRWDPTDPLAVGLVFGSSESSVVWLLGRELLATGLHQPAGVGDVRLEPFVGDLLVTLDNSRHRATVLLPGPDVTHFLARTYQQVPLGAERVDLDLHLALLHVLEDGAR